MERYNCTCHCGGSMFYKHLHDPSCDLFMHGEEAPQSKEAQLQAALDAERANRLAMEACVDRDVKAIKDLKAQLATLQAQLAALTTAHQSWTEVLGEWLWNCTNLLGDYNIKTVEDFNAELNRRVAWLMNNMEHTLTPPVTREEQQQIQDLTHTNSRLRKALQPFAERWEYFERTEHPSGGPWPEHLEYADDEPSAIYLGQLKAAQQALADTDLKENT